MINKPVVITSSNNEDNKAALMVQKASRFSSRIHLTYQNKTVNAKSIMGMMTLPLSKGDEILLQVDGSDEAEAVKQLTSFLTENTI